MAGSMLGSPWHTPDLLPLSKMVGSPASASVHRWLVQLPDLSQFDVVSEEHLISRQHDSFVHCRSSHMMRSGRRGRTGQQHGSRGLRERERGGAA